MRSRLLALVVLATALTCLTCQTGDTGVGGGCPSGQVCGFVDHKFFSTYYCGGMGVGFSWREQSACLEQCNVAASWGCDASACSGNCAIDHGTGGWLPCTSANGGVENTGSCFLSGSGVNGETVPCVCN